MTDIKKSEPVLQSAAPSAEENLLFIAIKYKNQIIIALLLILAIGAGTFFWVRYQNSRELDASVLLSRTAPLLDRGEFKIAIEGDGKLLGLKKIADTYSGTPSGKMATLLLANAYYSIGDFDSALKSFSSVSVNNSDLAAAALAGAADCYINKSQPVQAIENYENASKKAENTVLKAQYLVKAAESCQMTNQLKKAAELYNKIIADYPGTTAAAVAQRSLWQISGKM
ncbi:MAG: tetratricopeptide repeat protein [Chlorobiaceae bacterium]